MELIFEVGFLKKTKFEAVLCIQPLSPVNLKLWSNCQIYRGAGDPRSNSRHGICCPFTSFKVPSLSDPCLSQMLKNCKTSKIGTLMQESWICYHALIVPWVAFSGSTCNLFTLFMADWNFLSQLQQFQEQKWLERCWACDKSIRVRVNPGNNICRCWSWPYSWSATMPFRMHLM